MPSKRTLPSPIATGRVGRSGADGFYPTPQGAWDYVIGRVFLHEEDMKIGGGLPVHVRKVNVPWHRRTHDLRTAEDIQRAMDAHLGRVPLHK